MELFEDARHPFLHHPIGARPRGLMRACCRYVRLIGVCATTASPRRVTPWC